MRFAERQSASTNPSITERWTLCVARELRTMKSLRLHVRTTCFQRLRQRFDSLVASRNGRDPTSGPMDLSVGRSVYSSRWLHQVPTASSICWRSSWRSSKRSVRSIDLTINLSYDSATLRIYRWIIIHFMFILAVISFEYINLLLHVFFKTIFIFYVSTFILFIISYFLYCYITRYVIFFFFFCN